MPVQTLSALKLNRALLARQGLLARKRMSVRAAIHAAGGLQSQEPKDPYVALWSRISGFRAERLREAALRREVVRGSYLRCTIHTVSVDDFVAFRPLLQPVIDRELVSHRAELGGFDPLQLEAEARALMAGAPMTARQMGEALAARFPQAQPNGLAYWIRTCIALAMVPGDDRWGYPRPPRFVPAEQWLGRPLAERGPDGIGAIDGLLLRGLAAIGPAGSADLRAWSGLNAIKPALEVLRPRLRCFRDEAGRELFDLPDAPRPRPDTVAPVRFLPEFDNTLLSHVDRSRVIPPRHAPRFAMAANGRRERAVLVDGFVGAVWNHLRAGDDATLRVRLFEPLPSATVDEVSAEAEALLRFLEPDADAYEVQVRHD